MSDRILGGACVLLAAGMAWAARLYVAPISYEPVGPRAFPMLLAALLALAGAWLVARPTAHDNGLARAPLGSLGLAVVAVLAYALLFQFLGFPVATTLMALPTARAFGARWKQALATGLVLGVALFFLFDRGLDVVLPTGLLSPLLGGH
jgi:putative tricarboxylic transport membrane protein